MGRFLKIAVYIAVLFLGYLWIATVAKSCNKTASADDNTEMVDDIANGEEFEDDFFGDDAEDETATTDEMGGGSSDFETSEGLDSETMDYTEVDEIIEKTKSTSSNTTSRNNNTTTTSSTRTTSSNSTGKFLLLAGSYLIEDNAEVMVKKLKKIGYTNAEIVVFDMSQYHSVCAGRFTSLSSANQESGSLKRKGVDNYVHTKQ